MTFAYGSGELVPGFAAERPIGDALDQAGRNFVGGLAVRLVILVTLLPWALVALLGWFAFRAAARRWERRSLADSAAAAPGPPA